MYVNWSPTPRCIILAKYSMCWKNSQPIKALFNNLYNEEDYPEIEGSRKEIVWRKIRKLKMRLKFCTGQTCQKCAKVIVKDYSTPKKVFKTHFYISFKQRFMLNLFISVLFKSFPPEKLLRSTSIRKWIFLWSINM